MSVGYLARFGIIGLGVSAFLCAPAVAQSKAVPTFSKEVSRIFQEKCETCHRPGSIAPMSLITYDEVRPWARSIRSRVALRKMPPWHIDKNMGIQTFKNDRSLTEAEIDTVVRWADGGAPQGDPKDIPKAIQWSDKPEWNFAKQFGQTEPDLVVTGPAYAMPAKTQDHWWSSVVPTGLTENRWVRAIEMRPSTVKGRRITHHATARLIQDEAADQAQGQGAQGALPGVGGYFMEWAVGKQGEMMRPNSGRLMMAGAKIFFDVHYSSVEEPITDAIQLGVYFYPKGQEPKHRQVLTWFDAFQRGKETLDIRPNQMNVHQGFTVLKSAARIESFQPHMHWRGKAMTMEAILPDGTRQVLSHVNDYNFNWHVNYMYTDDSAPLLPKGTIIHITAWHDNTPAHRSNPDPNQWVTWGDRTVDEMAHAWTGVTYLTDQEYEQELAARKAMQVSSR
jgi:hypothetical protein